MSRFSAGAKARYQLISESLEKRDLGMLQVRSAC